MRTVAALAALLEDRVLEKRVSRERICDSTLSLTIDSHKLLLILHFSFQLAIKLPERAAALAALLEGLVRNSGVSRE